MCQIVELYFPQRYVYTDGENDKYCGTSCLEETRRPLKTQVEMDT